MTKKFQLFFSKFEESGQLPNGIAGERAGPGGVAKMERVVAAVKQTCLYDAGTSIVVFASELERCRSHRRHHEQGKAHEDGQCCSHWRKGQR